MLVAAWMMIAAQAGPGGMPAHPLGPPPMIRQIPFPNAPPNLPEPPAPPVPSTKASPAKKSPHKGAQLVNLGEIFASANYPFWANQSGDQGSVRFRVSIDATGRMTGCAIIEPSPHETLNQPTCDLIMAKARFTPATDRRGRGMATTYTRQVRWTMDPPLPSPVRDQYLRVVIGLDAAGATWCRTEALPGAKVDPRTCDTWRATPMVRETVGLAALALEPAQRTMWELVIEQRSLVGAGPEVAAAADAIGTGSGEQLRRGSISRLTISPAGAVTGCTYVDPGDLPDDLQHASCARASATLFEGSDGGEERVMTFVNSVYLRRR